ncbi:hypothetical protein AEQU_1832 [Adlercreutzia equolifaciens DSM 19450]|nr:hypothetical protein AEQU_1832 [Adlercreutzia equolifaciens DSM 19450]
MKEYSLPLIQHSGSESISLPPIGTKRSESKKPPSSGFSAAGRARVLPQHLACRPLARHRLGRHPRLRRSRPRMGRRALRELAPASEMHT